MQRAREIFSRLGARFGTVGSGCWIWICWVDLIVTAHVNWD